MDDLTPRTETTDPKGTPKPAHRRSLLIGAIVLVLTFLAAAVVRRGDGGTQAAPPNPQQAATSPSDVIEATPEQLKQIQVEPVRQQVIDLDLETTGKIGFNEDRMTPVFAPYGGRVLEVLANKGDLVTVGQSLLVLESPDLVTAVNDLSAALSDVDKARIAMDAGNKAAQRASSLAAQEALATKELQAAEADLARLKEEYRRAQAAASVARNRLALFGKSSEEIAQLETTVTDQIDRRIVIRAPLAGTIVDRKVGPGQYIKPDNPDPLYLISDLSNVWVNADVYESSIPQIHLGAPVQITVPAYPDRTFPARIAAINPTVDPTTRTIHVRCLVPNSNGYLKPEMFATIRIGSAAKRTVSTVPSNAVLTQGAESYVLVEESKGRFRKRQVKSGREIQGFTVVESGLSATDRVVSSGVLLLNSGLAEK